MKKFLMAALVVASGLWAVPSQADPVLSLVPSSTSTTVGGSVTVDLVISGLTSVDEIVSAFDLALFFNPAVLGVSAGDLSTVFTPWGGVDEVLFSSDFTTPGRIALFLTAFVDDDDLAALQGDSVVLSTIVFHGLDEGFSDLSFGLDPDSERNVVGRNERSLNQVTTGTCIAVGAGSCLRALPEPTTLPLALLALAAGGYAVRRHRQAQAPQD